MVVLNAVIEKRARAAVAVLSRQAPVRAAYVFGSQVDGQADRWSDIDIAAFVEGMERWDLQRRAHAAVRVQRNVGDDIELHRFPAHYSAHPPVASFASYILRHGIRIALDAAPAQVSKEEPTIFLPPRASRSMTSSPSSESGETEVL